MYHSALKDEIKSEGLEYYKNYNMKAFIWNIINGLPIEADKCDVIYSEPAWKSGYETFKSRAGIDYSNYMDYLKGISNIIDKKPIWILTGKHALKHLPKPERIIKSSIHGYECLLLGWNDNNIYPDRIGNIDFIKLLANNYNCVYDFSCGYGNTGKVFLEKGKWCVLSDINKKCISIIRGWYESL